MHRRLSFLLSGIEQRTVMEQSSLPVVETIGTNAYTANLGLLSKQFCWKLEVCSKTFKIWNNGGKMYIVLHLLQSCKNASLAIAWFSRFGDTYTGSWWFSHVASRSTTGCGSMLAINWKEWLSNIHSVEAVVSADREGLLLHWKTLSGELQTSATSLLVPWEGWIAILHWEEMNVNLTSLCRTLQSCYLGPTKYESLFGSFSFLRGRKTAIWYDTSS